MGLEQGVFTYRIHRNFFFLINLRFFIIISFEETFGTK